MQQLRDALQAIRSGNDPFAIKPRAATPSDLSLKKRNQLYVLSPAEDGVSPLPRPITAGLRYAADLSTFEELAERNILELPDEEKARIPETEVERIYRAKCQDQLCPISFDRMNRFLTLMGQQCKGQWFILRQCGLGINATRAVCQFLAQNDHYTCLDMSGNDLSGEGGKCVADLLRTNSSLCVLRLQSANLGESGIYSIVDALHKNNTLTALDFSGISGIHRNNIWGRAAKALGYMLQVNQVLSHLNLSCTGIQRSAPFVLQSCTAHLALTHLDLSGNSLHDDCCVHIAKLLTEGNCALETLLLDHNCIGDEGITNLAAALNSSGTPANALTVLGLSRNLFGSNGCTALGDALGSHPSLLVLNLESNKLNQAPVDDEGYRQPDTTDGLRYLFKCLETNTKLHTLKLAECGIITLPMPQLAVYLERTTALKTLDLSNNRFGDVGASAIATGLAKNATLETLWIAGCGIGNEGGAALTTPLENHAKLRHLRIQNVALSLKASGLLNAIRGNHTILSVDGGKDYVDLVGPTLVRNKHLSVKAAGPALAKVQHDLQDEKDDLARTQDLIADEVRRREKLLEAIKVQRERHKTVQAAHKNELEELQEQVERVSYMKRALEKKLSEVEDATAKQRGKMEADIVRMNAKIESAAHHKQEAKRQAAELVELLKPDAEVDSLEKELRSLEAELDERKTMFTILQHRITELEQPRAGEGQNAKKATNKAKKKK